MALARAHDLDDPRRIAESLDGLGLADWFQLAVPEGIAANREVLVRRATPRDGAGRIWPSAQSGCGVAALGCYDEGRALGREAARICGVTGDRMAELSVLYQIGLIALWSEMVDDIRAFEDGLAVAQVIGHTLWVNSGIPLTHVARAVRGEYGPNLTEEEAETLTARFAGAPEYQAFVTAFGGQAFRRQGRRLTTYQPPRIAAPS